MILNKVEKKRIVTSLSWMIIDNKHRTDEIKGTPENGITSDYSDELRVAIELLNDIEKIETVETTGCHRQSVSLNCREFRCGLNRQGICASSKVTLESEGSLIVGKLKCEEAEDKIKKDEVL